MPYRAFISYSHTADSKLAPALQSALRRIDAPWYRRAPFRIFLDNSSLSANPALWQSIETALGQSEYLLLLASSHSAQSPWVSKEISWWLANRSTSKILLLVTEGEIIRPAGADDFDFTQSTALNPALQGQFKDEPLWVDMRWARSEQKLSLRNPRFRNAILQIAPPLYGQSREALDDADTRNYKSAWRLAAFAIVALTALVIGIAASLWTARRQHQVAGQQRSIAECRELAGKAVEAIDTRLDLALLLAAENSPNSACLEGKSALLSALERRWRFAGFLSGHTGPVTNVTYFRNGQSIAAASWDKTIRLWDVRTRKPTGPQFPGMYGFDVSPGNTLLASTDGESLKLFRLSDAGLIANLPVGNNEDEMSRVRFSPDGKLLAASNEPTGINHSKVRLFDVATRQPIGDSIPAQIFAFSPDSKTLATDGDDRKSVVLWDLQTRQKTGKPLTGHTANVRCLAFSKDGNLLASGGDDNNVIAWNLRYKDSPGFTLSGHRGFVHDVAFSPTENILASGSVDGAIILWNLETVKPFGAPLTVGPHPAFSLAFSPDGHQLASTDDNRVTLWYIRENLPINHTVLIPEKTKWGPVYAPDGKSFATIDTYGSVNLSDSETFDMTVESLAQRQNAIAFSPDNKQFATVRWDGILAFFDRTTGQPIGDPIKTGFRLWSVAFSPNGRTLAVGGDATLLLWDVQQHRWKATKEDIQKDRIWSVSFSPDSKLVASVGLMTFAVWDGLTGANVAAPISTGSDLPNGRGAQAAFSPDGKIIAYPTTHRGVALWDVAHKAELTRPLSGHSGLVTALAFSPDNRILATAGDDSKVILWDMETHQPIGGPLTILGEEIQGIAFRPHQNELAILDDSRMLAWDVDPKSWRKTACLVANRELSQDEWSKFIGPQIRYAPTCP